MKDFEEASRLDPKNAKAYYGVGSVWAKKGEYEKAIKSFDEAIRVDPNFAWAILDRGSVF